MVLLTITPAAKTAIDLYNELKSSDKSYDPQDTNEPPPTIQATFGGPISHGQLIHLSRFLQDREYSVGATSESVRLDALLKGSNIWTPPPKPRPEHVCKP